jgi:RNAse (barnase) inhibitor barstar
VRTVRRPTPAVVADAERRGAAVAVVGPAQTKAGLLDEFARALRFPDWVGRNWDALADALGDLSWLPPGPQVVVWAGADALRSAHPAAYRTALEVLRDAAKRSTGGGRPLTILLAPEPGLGPEPGLAPEPGPA